MTYQLYLENKINFIQMTTGKSERRLNLACGFGSPNYLKMVIRGERELTVESVNTIILGLGMGTQEATTFRELFAESFSANNATLARWIKGQF